MIHCPMIQLQIISMILVSCLFPLPLPAQIVAPSGQKADRKSDLDAFLADANAYEIVLETEPAAPLHFVPQPVMNWNGSAFVWTQQGRPEVIATFWKGRDRRTGQPRWQHAFHSLSDQPLTARFENQLIWSPKTPGLTFQPVPDARPPADQPRSRLTQMRDLAADFSVTGIYPRYESSRRNLRLLTQPIFRYASPPKVEDGAIFVYSADVEATDPDAFLLLELRRREGELQWEFAFARFHYVELTGYHRDKEVWKAEDDSARARQHKFGADPGRDSIYYSVAKPL